MNDQGAMLKQKEIDQLINAIVDKNLKQMKDILCQDKEVNPEVLKWWLAAILGVGVAGFNAGVVPLSIVSMSHVTGSHLSFFKELSGGEKALFILMLISVLITYYLMMLNTANRYKKFVANKKNGASKVYARWMNQLLNVAEDLAEQNFEESEEGQKRQRDFLLSHGLTVLKELQAYAAEQKSTQTLIEIDQVFEQLFNDLESESNAYQRKKNMVNNTRKTDKKEKMGIRIMGGIGQLMGVINAVVINSLIGGMAMIAWFNSMGVQATLNDAGGIIIFAVFGVFAMASSALWTRPAMAQGFKNFAIFVDQLFDKEKRKKMKRNKIILGSISFVISLACAVPLAYVSSQVVMSVLNNAAIMPEVLLSWGGFQGLKTFASYFVLFFTIFAAMLLYAKCLLPLLEEMKHAKSRLTHGLVCGSAMLAVGAAVALLQVMTITSAILAGVGIYAMMITGSMLVQLFLKRNHDSEKKAKAMKAQFLAMAGGLTAVIGAGACAYGIFAVTQSIALSIMSSICMYVLFYAFFWNAGYKRFFRNIKPAVLFGDRQAKSNPDQADTFKVDFGFYPVEDYQPVLKSDSKVCSEARDHHPEGVASPTRPGSGRD